jgi:hypothetical protein
MARKKHSSLRQPEPERKMIARTRKTKTRSNEDELAAFVQKKVEIDALLARLQSLSDDHFNYSPDGRAVARRPA